MKTAKKTLALVLALVMAIGMFGGVTAGALDYTDADEITYVEAVQLMTNLGVFEGLETGNFNPKGNLQRDAAVKIVAYVALGPTVAEGLRASSTGFNDVPIEHWASAYIAWAVENKVAVGFGDGTFGPTKPVTGLQFAKMLLVALGWGKNGEFEGENWGIKVSQKAAELKIFDGNPGGANHNTATREEACLYAFNLLRHRIPIVQYNALAGGYLEAPFGGTSAVYGNFADANHFDVVMIAGEIGFDEDEHNFIFTGEYDFDGDMDDDEYTFPLEDKGIEDFGRYVSIWVMDASDGPTKAMAGSDIVARDVVLGRVGAGADDIFDYTDSTKDVFIARAPVGDTDGSSIEVYYNGDTTSNDASDFGPVSTGEIVIALDERVAGKTDGRIDRFLVISKVFYLAGSDVEIEEVGGDTTINIDDVTDGIYDIDEDDPSFFFGYEDVKEGDGLLIATMEFNGGAEHYFIEKADAVDGKLTSRSYSGLAVVGINFAGKAYSLSGLERVDDEKEIDDSTPSTNVDAIIWLDNFGYAVAGMDAADPDPEYKILLAYTGSAGDWATQKRAEILNMDGTKSIIDLDDSNSFSTLGKFVTVEKVPGKPNPELLEVTDDGSHAPDASASITGNYNIIPKSVDVATGDDGPIKGNNSTVFLFNKGGTIDRYVGINNIPSATEIDAIEAIVGENGFAKYIYVVYDGKLSWAGASRSMAFFYDFDNIEVVELDDYSILNAVVGGSIQKVKIDNTELGVLAETEGLYEVTYDADMIIIDTDTSGIESGSGYSRITAGVITVDATTLKVADDVKIYVIDTDNKLTTPATLSVADADDDVWYITNDAGDTITEMYILVVV